MKAFVSVTQQAESLQLFALAAYYHRFTNIALFFVRWLDIAGLEDFSRFRLSSHNSLSQLLLGCNNQCTLLYGQSCSIGNMKDQFILRILSGHTNA